MKVLKKGVDYIGVGVGAVIINDEDKVLLAKRGSKAKNERGKWEFPGGGVEWGDTMRDSIIREIQEELGVKIEPLLHLPPIDHFIPDEKQHWVTSTFVAKIKRGKPIIKEPDKCDEIAWFTIDEAQKLDLSLASQVSIQQIKDINLRELLFG